MNTCDLNNVRGFQPTIAQLLGPKLTLGNPSGGLGPGGLAARRRARQRLKSDAGARVDSLKKDNRELQVLQDKPNEGWEKDRVPTCTSRILEGRSGTQGNGSGERIATRRGAGQGSPTRQGCRGLPANSFAEFPNWGDGGIRWTGEDTGRSNRQA